MSPDSRHSEDRLSRGGNREARLGPEWRLVLLAEEPNRELVVGTLVVAPRRPPPGTHFAAISGPGYAKAALNFHIEPEGSAPPSGVSSGFIAGKLE